MRTQPQNLAPQWAILAVFCGGCAGTLLRYAGSEIASWWDNTPGCHLLCRLLLGGGGVNLDTWILNLLSIFILGYLTARLANPAHRLRSQTLKLLIGTGFCGALSTFGGPVWQVVSSHGSNPLYFGELLGLFLAGLLVGVLAVFWGSRGGQKHQAPPPASSKNGESR